MANIQVVDEIVKQTEELFREFYRDEETAFVFTADHGMSKIGNHGDGGEVRAPSRNPSMTAHLLPFIPCRSGQYAHAVDRMGERRSRTPTGQRPVLAR